jgi:hypothetical protein
MTDPRHDDLLKGRRESASLIGLDADNLSPADTLRCDLISALRLVIDDAGATILNGNSTDLGRLITATESLIKLLPGRELPEPASNRDDPREAMWATYKQMRDRGAQFGIGYDGLKLRVEALTAELASKEAELAALKAGAPTTALPAAPAVPPAGGNVVTLSRPPTERTTERSVVSPSPPPASPVLGDLVMVCDPSPQEPWKSFVEPDGSIRATPFDGGKYWGPV